MSVPGYAWEGTIACECGHAAAGSSLEGRVRDLPRGSNC